MLNRIRQVLNKSDTTITNTNPKRDGGCVFKLHLLSISLFTEEVDSLFCVTVVSNHLLNPRKGHPIRLTLNKVNLQVIWYDGLKNSQVLCSHPLHAITYQFHTSYKSRLYGYTAPWGRKKICLVFQAPRFSRIKGRTIRHYFDKMVALQNCAIPAPMIFPMHYRSDEGCSNQQLVHGDRRHSHRRHSHRRHSHNSTRTSATSRTIIQHSKS